VLRVGCKLKEESADEEKEKQRKKKMAADCKRVRDSGYNFL